MIGEEMARIRRLLDIDPRELAEWLALSASRDGGTRDAGAKRVMSMESGSRPITGPIGRCMEAFAAGWRPGDDDLTRPIRRMVEAVEGLLVEVDCATARANAHRAAGNVSEALEHASKAEALAKACNVMSRVLKELVDD